MAESGPLDARHAGGRRWHARRHRAHEELHARCDLELVRKHLHLLKRDRGWELQYELLRELTPSCALPATRLRVHGLQLAHRMVRGLGRARADFVREQHSFSRRTRRTAESSSAIYRSRGVNEGATGPLTDAHATPHGCNRGTRWIVPKISAPSGAASPLFTRKSASRRRPRISCPPRPSPLRISGPTRPW